MDGSTLSNRYMRYKAGTDTVVEWLATETQKCGASNISKVLPKLRDAKEAVKEAKKGRNVDRSATTVLVRVADLITLAKVIASSNLPIPSNIISVIEQVIAGRQACAEWYTSATTGEAGGSPETLEEDNRGHQHFISALQQVLELLTSAHQKRPLKGSQKPIKTLIATQRPSNNVDVLANIFSQLEVHEPSDSPFGAVPQDGNASIKMPKITFELENSKAQVEMAIWSLLTDMYDIRIAVEDIWRERVAGTISYAAAGFSTSIACAIMRHIEDQFLQQFPQLNTYNEIVLMLSDISASDYDHDQFITAPESFKHHPRAQTLDPLDLLCVESGYQITALTHALSSNEKLRLAAKPRIQGISQTKPHGLFEHIRPLLPLFLAASESGGYVDMGYVDSFTEAIYLRLIGHADFSLSIVVIYDMLDSVYEILGPDGIASGHDFAVEALQADMSMLDSIDARRQSGLRPLGPISDRLRDVSRKFGTEARRYLDDPTRKFAKSVIEAEGNKTPKYCLYKAMVLTPSLRMWLSRQKLHYAGMYVCNYDQVVLSTAYLYKVVETSDLHGTWADMEHVISVNSKKSPFVRKSSMGVQPYAKYFGMAMGIKATAFLGGRLTPLPDEKHMQQHARTMQSQSAFHQMWFQVGFSHSFEDSLVRTALKCLQQKDICDISPVQLLNGVKQAHLASEVDWNFNYLEFAQQCHQLLDTVRQACKPIFTQRFPTFVEAGFVDSSAELTYVILQGISDSANKGELAEEPLLQILGEVFSTKVGSSGDGLVREARAQSSKGTY